MSTNLSMPVVVQFETPTTAELITIPIDISTSGDNVIVPAVVGQVIRVFKIFAVSSASVSVTPKDGMGGTPLTGPLTLGGFVLDFDAEPWFTTSPGNAFILNLSSAVQLSGSVYYTQG